MEIKKVAGEEAKKYYSELARIRMEVFSEFPYLYDGDWESEIISLQRYSRSENFVMFVAFYNGQPVGMNTCLPLTAENRAIRQPFIDRNLDINKYYYFAESVLLKPYRGKGIGKRLLLMCEDAALSLHGIEFTCFCAVRRELNHPERPSDYVGLEEFWKKYGYIRQDNLVAKLSWKEIHHDFETPKDMVFWIKPVVRPS